MKGRYERRELRIKKRKTVLPIIAGILVLFAITAWLVEAVIYNSVLGKINHVDVPDIVYTSAATAATVDETERVTVTTSETEQVVTATEPHVQSSADYINLLVVGQAARDGESERFADTMILCTVNTYEKTLTMTSLLRDSFVKMPDYKGRTGGRIKLTTIYHLGSTYGDGVSGSMELMNQTLYDNFGIEVDHNFESHERNHRRKNVRNQLLR